MTPEHHQVRIDLARELDDALGRATLLQSDGGGAAQRSNRVLFELLEMGMRGLSRDLPIECVGVRSHLRVRLHHMQQREIASQGSREDDRMRETGVGGLRTIDADQDAMAARRGGLGFTEANERGGCVHFREPEQEVRQLPSTRSRLYAHMAWLRRVLHGSIARYRTARRERPITMTRRALVTETESWSSRVETSGVASSTRRRAALPDQAVALQLAIQRRGANPELLGGARLVAFIQREGCEDVLLLDVVV